MPVLSSFLLIQASNAVLLSISFLLITSPSTILSSTTLYLLGSSMHIRPASFILDPPLLPLRRPSPSGQLGISDNINPLTSLTRSTKTTLSPGENELLALLGLVVSAVAASAFILAMPLRFSKASLTGRTTSDGKTVRRDSREVGELIAKLYQTQNLWQVLAGVHVLLASGFVAWCYVFRSQRSGGRVASPRGDIEGLALLANNVTFSLGMVDMLFWGYLYTNIKEERRTVGEVRERRRQEDEEDETNQQVGT